MSMKAKALNDSYAPSLSNSWTGRSSIPGTGNDYWHQKVELIDLSAFQHQPDAYGKIDYALLGYACDEGIRRNAGRVGARNGPKSIRERLAKLPYHNAQKRVCDFGDIECKDRDMETTQKLLSEAVSDFLAQDIFPILLGGGHDMSYGHFRGIWNHVKDKEDSKIGIINFDAHFDLRPLEKEGNSGTPFYQILKEYGDSVDYFVLGIQEQSNTQSLFELVEKFKVPYVLNYDCDYKNLEAVKQRLQYFIERNDYLYVTIDMDGFSSAYAPGVSAPSPMGFTPYFVLNTLRYLLDSKKVISCDIAELNPKFDLDYATANLAGRLVDFIVSVLFSLHK